MSSFPALLGRKSGTVTISRSQIDFVSDDLQQRFSIPLESIQIKIEGQNSVHFYLSNKAYSDPEICLQDTKAIELLSAYGFETAATTLKQANEIKAIKTALWSSPIALGLAALLLVPLFMSFIPVSWINKMVSIEQEKALGNLIWPKILTTKEIQEDAKERIALQKNLDALIKANPELSQFEFQVHVNDDSEVNAFALPGGRIIINKGLLERATPEEVLGVMAHELAHVERRHILKSVSASMGSLVGYMIMATIAGPDAAGVLMSAASFTALKYSRLDEEEADRCGLRFIQNAGFSGQGMVSFFEKLAAKTSSVEKSLSFLSTHPASDDRAVKLKELIKHKQLNKDTTVTIPGAIAK